MKGSQSIPNINVKSSDVISFVQFNIFHIGFFQAFILGVIQIS